METFTHPGELVENTRYSRDREEALAELDLGAIDRPIVGIVTGFNALPHCYTLQSCWGHFICALGQDPRTLEPIPAIFSGRVRYRIAYLALCLEHSPRGQALRASLARIPAVDPDHIQFGTADWFRTQGGLVNSFALQVEPVAHQFKDEAVLEAAEARRTRTARDRFFAELRALLAAERGGNA